MTTRRRCTCTCRRQRPTVKKKKVRRSVRALKKKRTTLRTPGGEKFTATGADVKKGTRRAIRGFHRRASTRKLRRVT